MRLVVALSFEVDDPEAVAGILDAINPPSLPGFAGEARVAIADGAVGVERWLDALDPLLPPVPEPGDVHVHDAADEESPTVLRSFMVTAAVAADEGGIAPGVPVLVFDLVLADMFLPTGPAVPLRILVEHSDKSSRALAAGIQRGIGLLDELGKRRS